jgi:dTDP-4-dehydrorhamnose reductase
MKHRRRLLVTGGSGFVAGSVLAQAGGAWEVHAVSRGAPVAEGEGDGGSAPRWHRLDGLARDDWAGLFRRVRPTAVIHTAALADIDFCEANPESASAVNVGLTSTLTGVCGADGIRLVFCSTDTIFDGERAPYHEGDAPEPLNHYARTKVDAERCVAEMGPGGIIARLSLVIGLPVLGAGNSFVARLLSALAAGREVAVPERETRTPVDVVTLGRALIELAGCNHTGVFHLSGTERLNRLELSRRIAAAFGRRSDLVVPVDPARMAGRAPRPRDVSLAHERTRQCLATPMLDLDAGLSCIRQMAQGRRA